MCIWVWTCACTVHVCAYVCVCVSVHVCVCVCVCACVCACILLVSVPVCTAVCGSRAIPCCSNSSLRLIFPFLFSSRLRLLSSQAWRTISMAARHIKTQWLADRDKMQAKQHSPPGVVYPAELDTPRDWSCHCQNKLHNSQHMRREQERDRERGGERERDERRGKERERWTERLTRSD